MGIEAEANVRAATVGAAVNTEAKALREEERREQGDYGVLRDAAYPHQIVRRATRADHERFLKEASAQLDTAPVWVESGRRVMREEY